MPHAQRGISFRGRRPVRWAAVLVVALLTVGSPAWAQRSTVRPSAPAAVASLPAGDGAAALRTALAALPDVGAGEQAIVSFIDHAAVRSGGVAAHLWLGRQVAIGVVDDTGVFDDDDVEAATGLSLTEVATTLSVDASVPSYLKLVRGRFDADRLDAALTARGYAAVADEGARRWCGPNGCDGGFQTDMANRDRGFALFGGVLGRSFAALLVDDLLAVSPLPEALDAALATASGRAPSLLDRPEVAAVVDALDVDAVVRQVWMPFGGYAESVLPAGARAILFADARRGGDEWLVVAVAFEDPSVAAAFAGGALASLGLAGAAEFAAGSLQAALRARAADATVDRIELHGHDVVRIVMTRPFPDGVGTVQHRPAQLLQAMLGGVMRFALPWIVR